MIAGAFGFTFRYMDSHVVKYAENVTARVPVDHQGNLLWDWSRAPTDSVHIGGQNTAPVMIPGGGLYFVRADDGMNAFHSDNNLHEHYWLGNVTHPAEWGIETTYPDRLPQRMAPGFFSLRTRSALPRSTYLAT
jgi:hypothetical protein